MGAVAKGEPFGMCDHRSLGSLAILEGKETLGTGKREGEGKIAMTVNESLPVMARFCSRYPDYHMNFYNSLAMHAFQKKKKIKKKLKKIKKLNH